MDAKSILQQKSNWSDIWLLSLAKLELLFKQTVVCFLCEFKFGSPSHSFTFRFFGKKVILLSGLEVVPCCDRKSRAAYAQSFAPWQQATIEIMFTIPLIIAYSLHAHMFLFFAHIPFVVNHTINATPPERLQHCFIWLSQ